LTILGFTGLVIAPSTTMKAPQEEISNSLEHCRLQDEDDATFGEPITPESAVADAIRTRTEALLQRTGGTVDAKPIVMRAEYAYTSNLTLVDTPGFVLKV